jgi:hypothetical protein
MKSGIGRVTEALHSPDKKSMEAIMRGKIINFALLTVVSAGALVAAGCASGPNGLTGSDQAEIRERARWTDDKGRYHVEWRDGMNRPVAYPKNIQ